MKHFARLGGMVIGPRRTLQHMLKTGEGSLWEVLLWLVVITAAISPTRTGRALLVGRVDVFDGAVMFLNVVSTRMIIPLIATLVAAGLLFAIARFRHGAHDGFRFDALLDVTAFCLIPHLALAAIGALFLHFGIELWFMPHRSLNGTSWPYWVRGAVAFAWSLSVFLLLCRLVWNGQEKALAQGENS